MPLIDRAQERVPKKPAPAAQGAPAAAAPMDAAAAPQDDAAAGQEFQKPDIAQFVPPDVKDATDRVVAAGMRLMYAPEMREDIAAAIQSQEPMPKKLAENVTGLLLTLDQKAKGGIPAGALFPAAMGLLGEAADLAVAAGQQVTQSDYNDAALAMYALIGQKLGGTPEDVMGAAAAAMPGGAGGMPPPGAAQPAPPMPVGA
jgi:hypothetical protein